MMSEEDTSEFLSHFETLEDPRIDRKKLYPLTEILFVVICANICGAQGWCDFVTFLFLETEVVKTDNSKISDFYEEMDKGHGRIEHRLCYVSDQFIG